MTFAAELAAAVDAVAGETGFSGVVRVDAGEVVVEAAYGLADRAHEVPMTVEHPHRGRQRCQDVHGADGAPRSWRPACSGSTRGRGTCWAPTCRWWTTPSRSSSC